MKPLTIKFKALLWALFFGLAIASCTDSVPVPDNAPQATDDGGPGGNSDPDPKP
jgi:hypothetical protein